MRRGANISTQAVFVVVAVAQEELCGKTRRWHSRPRARSEQVGSFVWSKPSDLAYPVGRPSNPQYSVP